MKEINPVTAQYCSNYKHNMSVASHPLHILPYLLHDVASSQVALTASSELSKSVKSGRAAMKVLLLSILRATTSKLLTVSAVLFTCRTVTPG